MHATKEARETAHPLPIEMKRVNTNLEKNQRPKSRKTKRRIFKNKNTEKDRKSQKIERGKLKKNNHPKEKV